MGTEAAMGVHEGRITVFLILSCTNYDTRNKVAQMTRRRVEQGGELCCNAMFIRSHGTPSQALRTKRHQITMDVGGKNDFSIFGNTQPSRLSDYVHIYYKVATCCLTFAYALSVLVHFFATIFLETLSVTTIFDCAAAFCWTLFFKLFPARSELSQAPPRCMYGTLSIGMSPFFT